MKYVLMGEPVLMLFLTPENLVYHGQDYQGIHERSALQLKIQSLFDYTNAVITNL